MLYVISVEKIITCKFHLIKFHFYPFCWALWHYGIMANNCWRKGDFYCQIPWNESSYFKMKWLQDTELNTLKVRGSTMITSCCECIWAGLGLDIVFSVISVSVWPSSVAVCVVHHSVCSCEHVSYGHGKEATHLSVCVCVCCLWECCRWKAAYLCVWTCLCVVRSQSLRSHGSKWQDLVLVCRLQRETKYERNQTSKNQRWDAARPPTETSPQRQMVKLTVISSPLCISSTLNAV